MVKPRVWLVALITLTACRDYGRFRRAPAVDAMAMHDCAQHPGACGYPDESNTGVMPGTSLDSMSGGLTFDHDGVTVSNLALTGRLTITADHVTVHNVRVDSGGDYYAILVTGSDTMIDHVEVLGDGSSQTHGITCSHCTIVSAHVHGFDLGVYVGSGAVLQDSYVHDVTSAFASDGSTAAEAHGSTLLANGASGNCIGFTGDGATGLTVEGNLMLATGPSLVDLSGTATFTGNRIVRRDPDSLVRLHGTSGAPLWTGNVWDDTGDPVDLP